MDRERIAAKLKEMESYLAELKAIAPERLEDYLDDDKTRRACERLLQISIEAVIEVTSELFKGMNVGVPSDEDDILGKLKKKGVISSKLFDRLKEIKGFKNILVHRYGEVDDRLVFSFIENDLNDFKDFKNEVLNFLKKRSSKK